MIKCILLLLILFSNLAPAQFPIAAFWQQSNPFLRFLTLPQSLASYNCSGVMTVQASDSLGNPVNVTPDLTVSLTGTSGVTYYSDSACATPIIDVTITMGTSSKNFYFVSETIGLVDVVASATGYDNATQVETITANQFIWIGAGANANWSTGANWLGGVAPGTSNTAIFNDYCVSNCSPDITSNISVKGVKIYSPFAGTITQTGANTVTLAADGWYQESGSFSGGSGTITNAGNIYIEGGIFTSTSGTYTLSSAGAKITAVGSPTFNHNSGTFIITAPHGVLINSGTMTFNNVSMTPANSCSSTFATITGSMLVGGDLLLAPNGSCVGMKYINLGAIEVGGNLTMGGSSPLGFQGTTNIKLTGRASGQTITGVAGIYVPNLEIATGTHPVTLAGTLSVDNDYIVTSVGAFTATGSTLDLSSRKNSGIDIIPGNVTYNNVKISPLGAGCIYTGTLTGTFKVGGDLDMSPPTGNTCGSNLNSGTIELSGNLNLGGGESGVKGTTLVKLVGNPAGQTITGVSGKRVPKLELATGTNNVTFSGSIAVAGDYTVTSVGTLTTTGSTLEISSTVSNISITPGNSVYNHVVVNAVGSTCSWTATLNGTFNIGGNLTLASSASCAPKINTGTIKVAGDIAMSNYTLTGTSPIELNGTTNQIITATGVSASRGTWTINKSSGKALLASNLVLDGVSQDLTIQSGTLDLNGYALTVSNSSGTDNVLTIDAGATLIKGCTGTLTYETLVNNGTLNDGTTPPNITIADLTTTEGSGGTKNFDFTVSLSAPLCSGPVTVKYATAGDTAVSGTDFTAAAATTLTFAAGETTKTATVVVTSDTIPELDETFFVNLTLPTSGVITDAQAIGTIEDDDPGIAWTGATGNGLWNDALNWSPNTVPTSTTYAVFSTDNCTGANCNATINAAVNAKGVVIQPGYTGTITQSGSNTITIGSDGWIQAAGTFIGGIGSVSMTGPFNLSGGSYTATSNTTSVTKDWKITGSATFNPSVGTVQFGGLATIIPGAGSYHNVIFGGWGANYTLSGTMTVAGTTTLNETANGSIDGGTIIAQSNVVVVANGKRGSTLIKMTGNATLDASSTTTGRVPGLEFVAGANSISVLGIVKIWGHYTYTSGSINIGTSKFIFENDKTITPGNLTYNDIEFYGWGYNTIVGTFTIGGNLHLNKGAGSVDGGTIIANGNINLTDKGVAGRSSSTLFKVTGNSTITGVAAALIPTLEIDSGANTVNLVGTVDVVGNYTYTSGSLNAGTSTLRLIKDYAGTIVPGNVNYNHVAVGAYSSTSNLSGGTFNVLGDLTLSPSDNMQTNTHNNGTYIVHGNFSTTAGAILGTANVQFAGTNSQSITIGSTGVPRGTWTVNKPSGKVTLLTDLTLNGAGQDLTIASGTLDMNSFNLTVSNSSGTDNVLTINTGATLVKHCTGTLTYETLVNNGTLLDGTTPPVINIADLSTTESSGSTKNFDLTVSLASPLCSGSVTVKYSTVGDTAISGTDFTAVTNSTITFNAGETTKTATVVVTGDTIPEIDETFIVNLSAPTGGTLGDAQAIATIEDDDPGIAWTGATGNGLWNDALNWAPNTVPTITTYAVFSPDNCTGANCNATINAAAAAKGVVLITGYNGTITQSGTNTLTIGADGWAQAAGTFVGGSGNITINNDSGNFYLTGGSFTSTSGTLEVRKDFVLSAAGTFLHNNGTLRHFTTTSSTTSRFKTAGHSLYHYAHNRAWIAHAALESDVTVLGNLSIANTNNQGGYWRNTYNINVHGNISVGQYYNTSSAPNIAIAYPVVRLVGTGNQTVNGTGEIYSGNLVSILPNLTIDKPSGTAFFTGSFGIYANFKRVAGTVDASAATLQWGATGLPSGLGTRQFESNGMTVSNFKVSWRWLDQLNMVGDIFVNNDLTLDGHTQITSASGGNIRLKGNALISEPGSQAFGNDFNIPIIFEGTGDQTITNSVAGTRSLRMNVTVNKASGKVIQGSDISFTRAANLLTIQAGTWDMNGYALTVSNSSGVDNILTIDSGATLTRSGGTLTYETLVNNGTLNP